MLYEVAFVSAISCGLKEGRGGPLFVGLVNPKGRGGGLLLGREVRHGDCCTQWEFTLLTDGG